MRGSQLKTIHSGQTKDRHAFNIIINNNNNRRNINIPNNVYNNN